MGNQKPENRRKGGIAIVLAVALFLLAAGGAAYYVYTESSEEAYGAETMRLASDTSAAILQLDESSSPADFQRARKQISEYLSRKDAIPSARETWIAKIESAEAKQAQRIALVEQLRERVAAFDLGSSLAELEAFESELNGQTALLDTATRDMLRKSWAQRKQRIMAEINSVSATVIAKTFPSGAKTYLDGEYLGLSSLGIQNIRKGAHRIRFEKEGYLPAEIEIDVTRSEQIEPPVVELQMATNPISVKVTGGKRKADVAISIEKTADDNRDIILYIEELEGREVTFEQAPLGTLILSVTADLRLAHEQTILNQPGTDQLIEIDLEQ